VFQFEADQISDRISEVKDLLVHVSRMAEISAGRRKSKSDPPLGGRLVGEVAAQLARRNGNEALADKIMAKAITSPAQTTVPGWAQELSLTGLPGLILSIQRRSAAAAILARSPQVSMLGVGQVRVPIAAAATPASWVVEGAAIPVFRGTFSAATMSPGKIAAIISFSEELSRVSNIEDVSRMLLSQSVADGLDLAFFATSPPGVLAGLTPLTASTATSTLDALLADLSALLRALNVPSPNVVFAMAPSNYLTASALLPPTFGYTLAPSTALATGTCVAIDADGVAAALGEERFTISTAAAIVERDDPGAMSTVGSPNVIGAPERSLFQTDSVGVRVIAPAAWTARPNSAAVVNSVKW